MPERQDFLAAIRAAPDEDAPRLIYADWLEENGEADRADFIRFQVAAGAWASKPYPSGWKTQVTRRFGLDRLLDPDLLVGDNDYFLRGFPHRFSVGKPTSLPKLAQLQQREPMESILLRSFSRPSEALAETLGHAIELYLGQNPFGPVAHKELVRLNARHLRVEWSKGRAVPIDLELPNLQRLHLGESCGRDVALNFLKLAGPGLTTLELLAWDAPDPIHWPIGVTELALNSRSPATTVQWLGRGLPHGLERLHLEWREDETSGSALGRVYASDGLDARLRSLDLKLQWREASTVRFFKRLAPNLEALRVYVDGPISGDRETISLDDWPRLERLSLFGGERLHPDAIEMFAPVGPRVESLSIRSAAPGFFDGPEWQRDGNLRRLQVMDISDVEIRRLAECRALSRLEVLDLNLSGPAISAATVGRLARSAFGPNLRALLLNRDKPNKLVTEAAIRDFGPRCDAYWHQG